MSIRTRIRHAVTAGTAHAQTIIDAPRHAAATDDAVVSRVTAWQGRLGDAMRDAVREGTDAAIARVHATATEVALAQRAARVRFGH
jgi:hypothetical protein